MKDVGIRIRVEPELRESFVKICKEKDVPAAQVLRIFMKYFIESEGKDLQMLSINTKIARSQQVIG